MKKNELINQLEGLAEYATDYVAMSKHDDTMECADIWDKDCEALADAMLAVKMLHDIFENLAGQCLDGEMIAILSQMGYEPEDFERLDICTAQEVAEHIENFDE